MSFVSLVNMFQISVTTMNIRDGVTIIIYVLFANSLCHIRVCFYWWAEFSYFFAWLSFWPNMEPYQFSMPNIFVFTYILLNFFLGCISVTWKSFESFDAFSDRVIPTSYSGPPIKRSISTRLWLNLPEKYWLTPPGWERPRGRHLVWTQGSIPSPANPVRHIKASVKLLCDWNTAKPVPGRPLTQPRGYQTGSQLTSPFLKCWDISTSAEAASGQTILSTKASSHSD